jgi:GT2 family glycosyltransferase
VLTVVMTTRDRAAGFAQVLDAWESVASPRGGHRLVVVDDGSLDATAATLAERGGRLPLRAISAPRRGQNAARNAAMASVEGDLVVFTDDDAVPRRDFLVRLREAADAHPDADVLLGTVVPRFESPPPDWLLRSVRRGPTFAWLERDADGWVDPIEGVSPALAIRAARLSPTPFCESMGPDGTPHYAMGSETELLLRLREAGARAWYVKDAVAEHRVTAAQVEEGALLSRAYRYGRGQWRLRTARLSRARLRVAGVPVALACDVLSRRLSLARARRRHDAGRAFRATWRLAYYAGHLAEIRKERGRPAGLGLLRGLLPPVVREAARDAGATPEPPTPATVPAVPPRVAAPGAR